MSFKRGPRTDDEAIAAARELADIERALHGDRASLRPAFSAAIEVAAETVADVDANTAFGRAVQARRRATEAAAACDRACEATARSGLGHLVPKEDAR